MLGVKSAFQLMKKASHQTCLFHLPTFLLCFLPAIFCSLFDLRFDFRKADEHYVADDLQTLGTDFIKRVFV